MVDQDGTAERLRALVEYLSGDEAERRIASMDALLGRPISGLLDELVDDKGIDEYAARDLLDWLDELGVQFKASGWRARGRSKPEATSIGATIYTTPELDKLASALKSGSGD